jgi:hypothetical protein
MDTLANTAKTPPDVETVQPLAIPITTALSGGPTGVLSVRDQQQTTLHGYKTVQLEEKSKQEQQRPEAYDQSNSRSIQNLSPRTYTKHLSSYQPSKQIYLGTLEPAIPQPRTYTKHLSSHQLSKQIHLRTLEPAIPQPRT